MVILEGQLLKVEELPSRGEFPASWLISVLDPGAAEVLRLAADEEVGQALSSVAPLSNVMLKLAWRRARVERGAAYRLRAAGIVKPQARPGA